MSASEWLPPWLAGAAVGAVALAVVGFTWGGWMTGSSAEAQASQREKIAMVNALVPLCIARSGSDDPLVVQTLLELKDARESQRAEILMKAGWATPPGANAADRDLARACAVKLALAT
jgi:hypothetical protein